MISKSRKIAVQVFSVLFPPIAYGMLNKVKRAGAWFGIFLALGFAMVWALGGYGLLVSSAIMHGFAIWEVSRIVKQKLTTASA